MKWTAGSFSFTGTDLVGYQQCHHLTALERAVAAGSMVRPKSWSPLGELLARRGALHEQAFVDHLSATGLVLAKIEGVGIEPVAVARTLDAMRSGVQIIVQGALRNQVWGGRTDILRRVETPSQLGDWSYEVIDTKLSRLTKGTTLLQLSVYSELVGEAQGLSPSLMHVVVPWSDFMPESYRVNDYAAYYRLMKSRLIAAVNGSGAETYPDTNPHCQLCSWLHPCDGRRRSDDYLGYVAGISKLQIKELTSHGVATAAGLAGLPAPLAWKPSRGAIETYERVREQARVQVQGRVEQRPVFELLPRQAGVGLSRLPEPSPGDVFFDLEGDPNLGLGGSEYLFGYVVLDQHGQEVYQPVWAFTRSAERAAFEGFVDFIVERLARYPDLHIYHYAPYEPAALKRLMGRYASREEEIDRLLRAQVFVDLYPITKRAIRASVESYSIKSLEQFCGFNRTVPLDNANRHLAVLQDYLEFREGSSIPAETLAAVSGYNSDDCSSARALRDWFESLRSGLIAAGEEIPRPVGESGEASEAVSNACLARAARGRVLDCRALRMWRDDIDGELCPAGGTHDAGRASTGGSPGCGHKTGGNSADWCRDQEACSTGRV